MKILVLAHYYPPEMGGAASRLYGLTRWLARFGHDVTVITGFPNYPSGVVLDGYRGRLWMRSERDGVDVIETWVYASPRNSSLRRLTNYISFVLASMVAGLLIRDKYDAVLASSPPLFLGFSGWMISQVRGVPFVFDVRDLWPDVAIEAGEFAPDSPVTRMARWLAGFLYRRAEHVTPVTESKRKKILAQAVQAEKLTVVSNGVDLDLVTLASTDRRTDLGLDGQFVILYAGLIGVAQGVDVAVCAAEQLRDENVHFLIIGDGVKRQELLEEVQVRGLTNITMLPRQPRDLIPEFMATADVCLVPLVSSALDDAVPSKLLEAWAYQRPVILVAAGEAADIVQRCEGGLVVSPEEPDSLAEAIMMMKEDRSMLMEFARNGHAYVKECLDRPKLARRMEAVLRKVTGKR